MFHLNSTELRQVFVSARPASANLTERQRLGLCVDTSLSRELAASCPVDAFDPETLLEVGVRVVHFFALDISVATLRSLGFRLGELSEAGLDMLWLVQHPQFATDLVATFDPTPVREAFLVNAEDAVALSGEGWLQDILMSSLDEMLEATLGTMRATKTVWKSFSATQKMLCSPDVIVRVGLCRGDVPFDDAEIMRRMRPSVEAARALGIY